MLIQFSTKLMPTGSSASVPWPMCAPKLRTPGIFRSSSLACWVIRIISACDVPGRPTQCMRKSRSLNLGNSDWPRNGTTSRPATTSTPATAYAPRGRPTIRPSRAV